MALAGRAFADEDASADDAEPIGEVGGAVGVEVSGELGGELGGDVSGEAEARSEVEARSSIDVGSALIEESLAVTSGLVDADVAHESARDHRPSPWGHLDVALAWRRIDQLGEPRRHELWLVATWRN